MRLPIMEKGEDSEILSTLSFGERSKIFFDKTKNQLDKNSYFTQQRLIKIKQQVPYLEDQIEALKNQVNSLQQKVIHLEAKLFDLTIAQASKRIQNMLSAALQRSLTPRKFFSKVIEKGAYSGENDSKVNSEVREGDSNLLSEAEKRPLKQSLKTLQ